MVVKLLLLQSNLVVLFKFCLFLINVISWYGLLLAWVDNIGMRIFIMESNSSFSFLAETNIQIEDHLINLYLFKVKLFGLHTRILFADMR